MSNSLLPRLLLLATLAAALPAQSLTLNVGNGAGSGSFDRARTIHVWANPPAAGQVFDRWTGDTAALVDATAEHTVVRTSFVGTNATVAATYRAAPTVTPTAETFSNGTLYRWYVPPGPVRAVLTLHHGTGGSAANQFARPENEFFNREAAARGYALVAIDSLDRINKQWDASLLSSNADVQNVLAILAALQTRGVLPTGVPRYAVGMSNGGGFVPKLTAYAGYASAASYCAQAANALAVAAPIQWRMAMADSHPMVGTEGNDRALANYGSSQGRGTAAAYERNAPSPLHPARFLRIGLTLADGDALVAALRSGGYLDAYGFLLTPPGELPGSVLPPAYLLRAADIVEQLSAVYADHQFWSDAARRTFDFFESPASEALAQAPRQINLSTRAPVLTGENVLIGGFVVSGTVPKRVLVRAPGPSLAAFGVAGALTDPSVELVDANGTRVAFNEDWGGGGQQAEIAATGLSPSDAREPAVVATLHPGAYTAIVRGSGGATGIALIEVYDLDASGGARLANVSTRARVGQGDAVVIGGLVIDGARPKRVVLRALGPSLAAFGVTGALGAPELELRDGAGRLLARNAGWSGGFQARELGAARLAPSDARESALVVWLAPGAYTAIVRGVGGVEGVALVEAYELP